MKNFTLLLEMLDAVNERGLDISAEAYPYTAGMTRIDSGVFKPGWQDRLGIGPGLSRSSPSLRSRAARVKPSLPVC